MPLSLWMVVPPCLTVKPHPNWSLVNEPTVYTIYEVLRFCCFLEWEAWFLTPFCPRAILGSAFSRFLAGVSRRDAGISLLTFPTHWFAWVLSAGIFAVLSPLLDPSKTCPIQVCTPLCLSRLYGVGLWRAQDCEEYEQCAGLWRVFRTVKSSRTAKSVKRVQNCWSPFLTGRMFVRPYILRTLRRTMIHFLIELLVRRIWFGQSKLYFILNWLVIRCKLRPELAVDAQQTAWLKM